MYTWIILAILRLSLSMLFLHNLHDERLDLAYSVRKGKSPVAMMRGCLLGGVAAVGRVMSCDSHLIDSE